MREFAFLELETDELLDDDDRDAYAADQAFDEILEAGARGDWEAIGLDPPSPVPAGDEPAAGAAAFTPVTVADFMGGP